MSPFPQTPSLKPFAKLFKYKHVLFKYKKELLLGTLALIATNLLSAQIPWIIKSTVDTLKLQDATHHFNPDILNQNLLTILIISLVMLVIRVMSRQFLLGLGRRMEYDFKHLLYQHLLKMPQSFFMVNPTGELMSRLTNDVTAIRYLTGGGVMMGLNTLLAYCVTFPLMAFISPKLTLYAFLIYPIGIFVMQKLSKLVKNEYYAVQDILGDISSTAQENFSGMSVIQSYVKEPVESKRFQDVCLSYFQTYCKMINLRVWLFIVMAVISGISFLIILNEGGQEVIQGQLDLGGYIAFTLYLEKLAWPTMALGWAITTFQQGSAAIERIDDVLSADPSLTTPQPPLPLHPNQEVESLEIRNLTFQYTNPYQTQPLEQAPHPILKNISLSLKPGDTVAIVGHVGSGKSTLLSLIPRLHEMPEGAIFINHQDITQVSLKELRSLISYMPQQSFLFSTSIGENIAYGAPEATQKQIQDYATLAMLHPEVMQFDNHYQTIVGERGLILSGGQRQRLALARTLLVDAPILILDDPFSNLDADTEKLIIEGLRERKVFDNKITLFATHRFSLVSEASWIVLMDQGVVLATGSHRFLMDTQPLYRDLNQLAEQTTSTEEEGDAETAPQKRDIPVLASHLPMAEESTFGGESLS